MDKQPTEAQTEAQIKEIESNCPTNWMPHVGDTYAWRRNTLRKARLLTGVVISYDPIKKLVRGRLPSGNTERRHLCDVFRLYSGQYGR